MSSKMLCPVCDHVLVFDHMDLWGYAHYYCPNRNCDYRVYIDE